MSLYIDTRGRSTAACAICDRCKFKFPYDDLSADRDIKGLRVCEKCNDEKDPYKLAARKTEKITLRFPRPDEDLI